MSVFCWTQYGLIYDYKLWHTFTQRNLRSKVRPDYQCYWLTYWGQTFWIYCFHKTWDRVGSWTSRSGLNSCMSLWRWSIVWWLWSTYASTNVVTNSSVYMENSYSQIRIRAFWSINSYSQIRIWSPYLKGVPIISLYWVQIHSVG